MLNSYPTNGKNTNKIIHESSIQKKIEKILFSLVKTGLYESIYLYNADGLPIVENQSASKFKVDPVEISVMMSQIRQLISRLDDLGQINEIVIEGSNGKKIVFRYISLFNQTATLIATIPAGKYYRNITNRLQKTLIQLCEMEH